MPKFAGMNYSVFGQGKPILLLHGWGASGKSFGVLTRELSLDYKVYVIDFWGFGESEFPKEDAGIFDYANVVSKFIQNIILEPVVVIGHSFGGRVSLIIACEPMVEGVVLIDSAGFRERLSLCAKFSIKRYKTLRKKVEEGKVSAEKLKNFGSQDYRNLNPIMRAVFVRVVNTDLTDFAKEIKKPTLIIWGNKDSTTPMRFAKKFLKLIQNSKLEVISGGHFSYLDSPSACVQAINRFLLEVEERNV